MRPTIWMLALSLTACGDKESGEEGDDTGQTQTEPLPDVWDRVDESHCDDAEYSDVPGATSYFVGEFELVDDLWVGTEVWALYANDAWKDTGEDDCKITWTVQLEEGEAGACSACGFGLAGGATIDLSQTDCPKGLYKGAENQTLAYDVLISANDVEFYFSGSGSFLGAGYNDGGSQLNYISDPQCDYF